MSSKSPQAPAPQSTQETSAQAIQAQIDALPKILESQQKYGSQFTQEQLKSLQEFGPQFAQTQLDLQNQFGPQYAQSTLDTAKILSPEAVAAQNQLAKYFESGPPQLTEDQQRRSIQAVTSNAATRGLAESGFSATAALSTLIDQEQALKTNFMNQALSAAGKIPTGVQNSVSASPQAFGPGQLVQNVNPGDIFSYQSGVNSLRNSQYEFGQGKKGNLSGIGSLVGAGIGGYFGGLPGAKLGSSIGGTAGGSFQL